MCNICEPERGNKKGRKYLELAEKFRRKHRGSPAKSPDTTPKGSKLKEKYVRSLFKYGLNCSEYFYCKISFMRYSANVSCFPEF